MQGDSSPSPSPTTSSSSIRSRNRNLVHRICSGQVTLDLSSAIKELIENSLESGATSIEINLKDYGEEQFQVIDNGSGISPTNFKVLALKHHTSKLEDFRGGALSSLCALGNLTVETRTKKERVATLLTFDHSGLLISEKKTARQIGTTVTVRKVFSNLTVQSRDSKRNIRKDYGKLVSLLNAYGLISKGVRFVCSNMTEKTPKSLVLNTQGRGSLKDNIISVFGMNIVTSLQLVNICISDECKVEGFLSKPGQGSGRNVADRQYFFINGRPVDMPKVSKLLNELYKGTTRSRKYPIAILDFIVPGEVFSDESSVIGSLKEGLNEIYSSSNASNIVNKHDENHELPDKARVSSLQKKSNLLSKEIVLYEAIEKELSPSREAEIGNRSKLEKFKSDIKTRGAKKTEGSLSVQDESVSVRHRSKKKVTDHASKDLSDRSRFVQSNKAPSFRVEKRKFELRPLASRCQMKDEDQVDGLVVSKKDDVTPKEMDSKLRNRISPETRIDNVERHEREHKKPLCSEEPISDNTRTETILEDNPHCSQPLRSVAMVLDSPAPSTGPKMFSEKLRAKRLERLSRLLSTGDVSKRMKNTPQPKKMNMTTCVARRTRSGRMEMTTCVARRTRSRTESYLNSLLNGTKGENKRAAMHNGCSPPSAKTAKRCRRKASDDVVSMGNIFPDCKQEHAHVEDDNVFLGTTPPQDENVGSASMVSRRLASKLPGCDKDGDISVDGAKLRGEENTCALTPSAPEILERDEVTSLTSEEEGSVEELGTDSSVEFSDEDRDSDDSEDDDTESSDYTEESSDYSYIESSESDFDCSEDDEVGAKERKTPSEKVYTYVKPKTFPKENNLNVFELLEKSIWERTEISVEEMCSGDEGAEIESREDAIVRESSSEKVHEERKPRGLRRVKEKKRSNVFDVLGNSFCEKSCDGEETIPCSTEDSPPLNLRFGCEEEPEPIEKTEEEEEMDTLWEEMAFALTSEGVRSSTPAKKGDVPCISISGTHEFVLDEEIGLKCRYCSYVSVEIKNISPPMEKYHANVNDKKTFSDRKGDQLQNELDFEGSDHISHGKASVNNTQGTVWEGIPGIKGTLYPHQQDGFEFIWKNLAGTTKLEELKSSVVRGSGGCIISHAPGTGKTRLTIVFLQSYLEQFPDSHPLIIAPASLLLTWEEEFKKWNACIPFYNLSNPEFSGLENQKAVSLLKGNRSDKPSVRMIKLYSWRKKESVLGVSYHLFEKLAGGRRRQEFRSMLLELPGLLVLDEGHTPRNQNSCIWKVLSEVKTEKRIILSGTPFQNNFKELSNVLCLARPAYSATITSRLHDLSRWNHEGEKGKECEEIGIKELKDIIASFVHVHKGNFLRESLPGLRDCVVVLNPTYQQKKILVRIDSSQKTFELEHKRSSVSVHPSLYLKCTPTKKEQLIIGPSVRKTLEKISLDSNEGVKTRFLIDFLHFSESLKEKVLVFSQYLDTLELIIEHIKVVLKWTEGKEILYMNGRLEQKDRQQLISNFNKPDSEAKVLLASTKACSEGINLVGASRVVLLDVVWNPSVESQAISRAYRIGQKRVVYTYHLMVKGTTEWDKYCTQTKKHHISELVFSSSTDEKDKVVNKEVVSEDRILDEMVRHEKLKDMFEKILYHPKDSDMSTNIL